MAESSPNVTVWRWSRNSERAALLVAEDKLSDQEIADRVRVSKRTLERWKLHPDFRARVAEHVTAFRLAIRNEGIAVIENRVAALQDRWERLQRIIRERAEQMEGEAAGAGTGLLVKQRKGVGGGDNFEYTVDTGLLKELREHERQAAQELGQWMERLNVSAGDIDTAIARGLAELARGGQAAAPGADSAAAGGTGDTEA